MNETVSRVARVHTRRVEAAWRGFDLLLALVALAAFAPLMAGIALALAWEGGGPIVSRSVRVGRGGRPFRMWRFATRRPARDGRPAADPAARPGGETGGPEDAPRRDVALTRVGRSLRASTLEGLPQLLNVITGQMSLVGPKPLRPAEVAASGTASADRWSVKPGMTGLWRLSRHGKSDAAEQADLAVTYAQSKSLRLDARLLLETATIALLGDPSARGAW